MAEVAKVDPADFEPARRGVRKVDPKDFESAKPSESPGGVPPAGSLMDPHPYKTIGKTLAKIGAGVVPPLVASAALGPEAGAGLRIAAQAVGGALSPFTEWATAHLLGEHPDLPTAKQVLGSAVFNAAFEGSIGEGGAAITRRAQAGEGVATELGKLPQAQRTIANVGRIKQALQERAESQATAAQKFTEQDFRNKDFWKRMGLSDEQANQVAGSPDLQRTLGASVNKARALKEGVNKIFRNTEANFTKRFDEVLGKYPNAKVGSDQVVPIIQKGIDQLEPQSPFRQNVVNILEKQQRALGAVASDGGKPLGGVPVELPGGDIHVPGKVPQTAAPTLAGGKPTDRIVAPHDLNAQDISDMRTNLRRSLPSTASNTERKAWAIIDQHLEQTQDKMLLDAGAKNEEIGRLRDTYKDWGDYQTVKDTLNPSDERFGSNVAKALFSPMAKNPGEAMYFVRMAQEANKVHPGVMTQLRSGLLDEMAKVKRPGQPFEELEGLRKLQDVWGGDEEARAAMSGIFGPDSPLANPATFTKVVEAQAEPEKLAIKAQQQSGGYHVLKSPYIQGMLLYGMAMGAGAGGAQGGLFMALMGRYGLGAQAVATASLLAGPSMIKFVVNSGNSPLQRAMVGYVTNPNATNAVRYSGQIGGAIGGAVISQPNSPAQAPPP